MLPGRTDPRWRRLVEHPEKYTFKFLALKIMMQRVALHAGPRSTPAQRESLADEVYAFFRKNQALLRGDIAVIFG